MFSSKTNHDLSLASLEITEYSERAFFVCREMPTNKKGSALLKSLLAEGHRILRRIGISPILLKQILLRACALKRFGAQA